MKYWALTALIVGLIFSFSAFASPGDQTLLSLAGGGLVGHGGWLLWSGISS